jgi:hypothetical protein
VRLALVPLAHEKSFNKRIVFFVNKNIYLFIILSPEVMADDYIPEAFSEFNDWQKQFVNGLLTDPVSEDVITFPPAPGADPANWQIWEIPQADTAVVVDGQATFQPFFDDWSDEDKRNDTIIENHKREHDIYEKLIRDYVGENLRNNSELDTGDLSALGLTVPDTERTDKPQLEDRPLAGAKMKGGALLKLQFKIAEDSTRPSMHPDAHALELKYQVGGTEPENAAATNKSATFTKARHNLQLDTADAGKFFYGFARWINTSDNSKSGPYSFLIKIIISN